MAIQENTFAEACYNGNSSEELKLALSSPADEQDMKTWNLSEAEYYSEIQLALAELESDEQ